jgi:LmbE family N-acetylglucosaminyl deacetylase
VRRALFLIGRRAERTRGRLRAARERARLRRDSTYLPPGDRPDPDPVTQGGTLAIIPHQADDLLFFSTMLARDAREGRPVLTVHLTAGDDDDDDWYWRAREAGVRAAYAALHGVPDRWTVSTRIIADKPLTYATLQGAKQVGLLFLRLPDGGLDGQGGARSGFASLRRLWEGDIATISAVDGSATQSLASLQEILRALLDEFRPDRIASTDHLGSFGDGDHSDHYVAGYLADLVQEGYAAPHEFVGFRGYEIEALPSNLAPADIAVKERAYFAYAASDYKTPQTLARARADLVGSWLTREYAL